jgi:hypothetical protein
LAPPPQRPARWDLAEPGQYVNTRLTAIVPAEVPSLEQMLDQGREDIGSQSPTLDELPPEPDEPPPGFFNKLGRSLQRKLAQMMKSVAEAGGGGGPQQAGEAQGQAASRSPAKPGVFSKMANWARQKMAQIDDSLRKSRHRELHRLMNLLQNDPDRGLRFALPCGEGQHRGIGAKRPCCIAIGSSSPRWRPSAWNKAGCGPMPSNFTCSWKILRRRAICMLSSSNRRRRKRPGGGRSKNT